MLLPLLVNVPVNTPAELAVSVPVAVLDWPPLLTVKLVTPPLAIEPLIVDVLPSELLPVAVIAPVELIVKLSESIVPLLT